MLAPKHTYIDIEIPKNTPLGIYIAAFSFLMGFGLVWHIFWLALLGVVGIIGCLIRRLSEEETEVIVPAQEIENMERAFAQRKNAV